MEPYKSLLESNFKSFDYESEIEELDSKTKDEIIHKHLSKRTHVTLSKKVITKVDKLIKLHYKDTKVYKQTIDKNIDYTLLLLHDLKEFAYRFESELVFKTINSNKFKILFGKGYSKILKLLIDNKIIESDGKSIIGVKSYGYRLHIDYIDGVYSNHELYKGRVVYNKSSVSDRLELILNNRIARSEITNCEYVKLPTRKSLEMFANAKVKRKEVSKRPISVKWKRILLNTKDVSDIKLYKLYRNKKQILKKGDDKILELFPNVDIERYNKELSKLSSKFNDKIYTDINRGIYQYDTIVEDGFRIPTESGGRVCTSFNLLTKWVREQCKFIYKGKEDNLLELDFQAMHPNIFILFYLNNKDHSEISKEFNNFKEYISGDSHTKISNYINNKYNFVGDDKITRKDIKIAFLSFFNDRNINIKRDIQKEDVSKSKYKYLFEAYKELVPILFSEICIIKLDKENSLDLDFEYEAHKKIGIWLTTNESIIIEKLIYVAKKFNIPIMNVYDCVYIPESAYEEKHLLDGGLEAYNKSFKDWLDIIVKETGILSKLGK